MKFVYHSFGLPVGEKINSVTIKFGEIMQNANTYFFFITVSITRDTLCKSSISVVWVILGELRWHAIPTVHQAGQVEAYQRNIVHSRYATRWYGPFFLKMFIFNALTWKYRYSKYNKLISNLSTRIFYRRVPGLATNCFWGGWCLE